MPENSAQPQKKANKVKKFLHTYISIVRSGLLMLIPVLMVGSAALILRSLPISAYQSFISSFARGLLYSVFDFIFKATFGMLSLYMVVFLAGSYTNVKHRGENRVGAVSAGISSFLISVGFLTESFQTSSFSAVGMFTAIICGMLAPSLYIALVDVIKPPKMFCDGSDPMYNNAISSIIPLLIVCLLFALFNFFINIVFGVANFWELFSSAVNKLFSVVGLNFFGGFLYILLSSVMWFFGIHGSDVLESVTNHLFVPAMEKNLAAVASGALPTEIYTKTFFDVFVLIGGCGSALSLLAAILLFSRRKSSRSLTKLAALPMLFNINELMIFGLPVIYNPNMLIPFICAPLCCFVISTLAMSFGLVPLTTSVVEWTTPILLGGYRSTGSVAGSILQLVNFSVGVLIYMPFIRRYDRAKEEENRANYNLLVDKCRENEKNNESSTLTEESGLVGAIAKQLVTDLRDAVNLNKLSMMYQPQCDADNVYIGAEALLRWEHSSFGFIYPPLIIKLAAEGGFLIELEKYVFTHVRDDIEKSDLDRRVSINVTSVSLQNADFIEFLYSTFPDAKVGNTIICIEITEQTELITNSAMIVTLAKLHDHGFLLAIDDFSMGFTSVKYLQDSRFDEVKLDGSLVRGMTDNLNTRQIISSIVFLSRSLGFSVLAEFVETPEQQKQLEDIGCRDYQGYLYSRPLPLSELAEFYRGHK